MCPISRDGLEPLPDDDELAAPLHAPAGDWIEGWRREQRYLTRNRIWIFNLNDRWVRDAAVGGNIARYVNHACRPNCYTDVVGRRIWIIAARPIATGEELTYDYNTDGVAGIRCLCRPGCRRVL